MSKRYQRKISCLEKVLEQKEFAFRKAVGYDQMGDGEEDVMQDDIEFKSHQGTVDWVRQQAVEVESMTAYAHENPMRSAKRKRVDVDMEAGRHIDKSTGQQTKVIAWIDPSDRLVF